MNVMTLRTMPVKYIDWKGVRLFNEANLIKKYRLRQTLSIIFIIFVVENI